MKVASRINGQRLQQAAADDPDRTSSRHFQFLLQLSSRRRRISVCPADSAYSLALLVHGDQFELERERRHKCVFHHQPLHGRKCLAAQLDVLRGARRLDGGFQLRGTAARPPFNRRPW